MIVERLRFGRDPVDAYYAAMYWFSSGVVMRCIDIVETCRIPSLPVGGRDQRSIAAR